MTAQLVRPAFDAEIGTSSFHCAASHTMQRNAMKRHVSLFHCAASGFARQLSSAILCESLQVNSASCWAARSSHTVVAVLRSLATFLSVLGKHALGRRQEYGPCPTCLVFLIQFGGILDQRPLARSERHTQ